MVGPGRNGLFHSAPSLFLRIHATETTAGEKFLSFRVAPGPAEISAAGGSSRVFVLFFPLVLR
jgi:hypothetical protein